MTLSEGGIGWIPYFLERADITHDRHGDWSRSDFGGRKPSEVFHDHIVTCFIDESFGVRNIADIGEDMVTLECDYPHADTTWPEAPEFLWPALKSLSADVIDKVTHQNAMRLYYFRSEEHTSELQSLMRISYAVFCLKKKKTPYTIQP